MEKDLKINDNSFLCLQPFMRKKYNLKGNELMVYALIHGFSMDGESYCSCSWQYIADWIGADKRTVARTLNSLESKNLIKKEIYFENKVKYCRYYTTISRPNQTANDKMSLGVMTKCHGGNDKMSHNSIVDNKEDSIVYSRPQSQLEKVGNNITESNTHTPSSKSSIPTLAECEQYAKEKEYDLDVERFYNYYDALGWSVKGNPVTNWKALLTNWVKNQYPNHESTGNIGNKDKMMALATTGFETPEYDF